MFKNMKKSQSGFTLVEIMIVVGIIAILAGMFLVGAAKFRASANAARVKSDVQKIEALQELYATRKNGTYAGDTTTLAGEVGTLPTLTGIAEYSTDASKTCADIKNADVLKAMDGTPGFSGTNYCLTR